MEASEEASVTVTAARADLRVRPRGDLVRTGVVSIGVAMIPLTAAVWVAAMSGGNWRLLVGIQAVAILLGLAAALRWRMVETRVSGDVLSGNGFLSPVLRVPFSRIAAAYLVPTYTHSGDIVQQLLVVDADGRRLFRRRGTYWGAEALKRIGAALPVPVEVVDDPVSIRAFWRAHPSSSYWFEDSAVVRVLTACGVVLLALGLAAGTLAMMR